MEYLKGNLFDANTQALVNTVNTVGVMGKGIALQFKERFPVNYNQYITAYKKGILQIGKLLVVKEQTIEGERIIVNFPTKTEWYLKSKYSYIEDGLKELVKVIEAEGIESIALPPLGCGNGGLKWEKVKVMIEKYLGHFTSVRIQVYEPNEAVNEILKQQEISRKIKLTQPRAMLLYAMFYYESLGESSSLFVANKLAYFLQRLGEKSLYKLQFEGYLYGPYSPGVVHVLHHLNGVYIKGLEQMNAKAFEPLALQYDKLQEVSDYVKKELSAEQRERLSNLIKLIDGFQSALSLEILATVDFIKRENPGITYDDIVKTIQQWSERKHKLFKEKYIKVAALHLEHYSNRLEIIGN
ncbi:O-acetyl-ADP-ribose deacetylase (regulator of RNase III), contains Macro domain [Chitinophaga costaii]|uniref:O-acetyl-ADP-ribose deacetylase (Regulator of RNase III), contains Macro domain n=1 Tax=Chitinophaga costaii TaxID=1335309 RepID=A0A1C4E3Q8_9BACT|nr:macro domain-containing protein [Chitinophaga costaii]PUZ24339.1 phosphatase [Chitinophaga costaii]SCC38229.1 O-acetyl-ADP-ribose deacetylase (regulator of RNase III), contains Macro domain [Chitinophaga costaii]